MLYISTEHGIEQTIEKQFGNLNNYAKKSVSLCFGPKRYIQQYIVYFFHKWKDNKNV